MLGTLCLVQLGLAPLRQYGPTATVSGLGRPTVRGSHSLDEALLGSLVKQASRTMTSYSLHLCKDTMLLIIEVDNTYLPSRMTICRRYTEDTRKIHWKYIEYTVKYVNTTTVYQVLCQYCERFFSSVLPPSLFALESHTVTLSPTSLGVSNSNTTQHTRHVVAVLLTYIQDLCSGCCVRCHHRPLAHKKFNVLNDSLIHCLTTRLPTVAT